MCPGPLLQFSFRQATLVSPFVVTVAISFSKCVPSLFPQLQCRRSDSSASWRPFSHKAEWKRPQGAPCLSLNHKLGLHDAPNMLYVGEEEGLGLGFGEKACLWVVSISRSFAHCKGSCDQAVFARNPKALAMPSSEHSFYLIEKGKGQKHIQIRSPVW